MLTISRDLKNFLTCGGVATYENGYIGIQLNFSIPASAGLTEEAMALIRSLHRYGDIEIADVGNSVVESFEHNPDGTIIHRRKKVSVEEIQAAVERW